MHTNYKPLKTTRTLNCTFLQWTFLHLSLIRNVFNLDNWKVPYLWTWSVLKGCKLHVLLRHRLQSFLCLQNVKCFVTDEVSLTFSNTLLGLVNSTLTLLHYVSVWHCCYTRMADILDNNEVSLLHWYFWPDITIKVVFPFGVHC